MRRLGLVAGLVLLVALLAACQGFSVQFWTNSTNHTLASGGTADYFVSVPADQIRSDRTVHFELDQDLEMSVYESDDSTFYAAATSGTYFADQVSLASVGSSSSQVTSQAIQPGPACSGSCVIHPSDASGYYVHVTNQTGAAVTVTLKAFTAPYQDQNEPANNRLSTATYLYSAAVGGALETIGDHDYFRVQNSGALYFTGCTSAGSMDPVADVYSGGSFEIQLSPGDYVTVSPGDYADVHSKSGDYAAPASTCIYYMQVQ